jgi:ABC-type branched-subunit amino acid transport system ATPase component
MSGFSLPAIQCDSVSRHFGGLRAVSNVSFEIAQNSIVALIGPNGAGKTTIFNLISGLDRPTSGRILLYGRDISRLPVHIIAGNLRVVRTFQNVRLFPHLSVLDNVRIGAHARSRGEVLASILKLPWVFAEEAKVTAKAWDCLHLVGLAQRAHVQASDLSYGEQRLVEIARAAAVEPRCLLLDEPAAGLNSRETERLAELICLIREAGVTIVLVEHKMDMVMRVSEHVLVLNFGELIASATPSAVQRHSAVIEAYLGGGVIHSQHQSR